jgi:hypothetical protein
MTGVRRILKLIGLNLLVFFVLGNLIYWAIPTVAAVSNLLKPRDPADAIQPHSQAYTPADADWLAAYSREKPIHYATVYRSFVGWRSPAFAGTAINIEGPYHQRRTVNPKKTNGKTVYFFGGSTMWGYGANDAGTIPSQFAALTGVRAENFGEKGWTAHQSLVMLIQLLADGHRPDLVVFYDGINEVISKCGVAHSPSSHGLESDFADVLQNRVKPNAFKHYFAPVAAFAAKIQSEIVKVVGQRPAPTAPFDCHRNPGKVRLIVHNLMHDWSLARELTAARGIKFVAALQPVSYHSRTRLEHLDAVPGFAAMTPRYRPQFEAVYPLLRSAAADHGHHDLVATLDQDRHYYVDPWHISPAGNRLITEHLAKIAAPLLAP